MWVRGPRAGASNRHAVPAGVDFSRAALWQLAGSLAHHVLHLGRNVQRHVRRGAASTPGDVAKGGAIRRHAVEALEKVLHPLRASCISFMIRRGLQ